MRLAKVTWGVGLVLGAAGCAQLLSIQDRTYEPANSSSTSMGSGSTGSASTGGSSSKISAASGSSSVTSSTGSSAQGSTGPGDGGMADVNPPTEGGPPPGDGGCPADSRCELASGLDWPDFVVADENNVYWTEAPVNDPSSVKSCPVSGCGPNGPLVYFSDPNLMVGQLAIDSTNVYWATNSSSLQNVHGGIFSCPIAGCPGDTPHTILANTDGLTNVIVGSTYLYYVNEIAGAVHAIPKNATNGAGDTVLYAGTMDINDPYDGVVPGQLAVDTSNLYFADSFNGGVWRAPLAGGRPVLMIFSNAGHDLPVAVDSTFVYYGDDSANAVVRNVKTGTPDGGSVTVAVRTPFPSGMAIDSPSNTIYWSDVGTAPGTINKVSLGGGTKTVIDSTQSDPQGVAIDSTYVFYVNQGLINSNNEVVLNTGSVWRAPR